MKAQAPRCPHASWERHWREEPASPGVSVGAEGRLRRGGIEVEPVPAPGQRVPRVELSVRAIEEGGGAERVRGRHDVFADLFTPDPGFEVGFPSLFQGRRVPACAAIASVRCAASITGRSMSLPSTSRTPPRFAS